MFPKIVSANKTKRITYSTTAMAGGMQEVCTSDGAVSRINEKAMIDFLLESDSDFYHSAKKYQMKRTKMILVLIQRLKKRFY